jgi:hypothetical protein
VVLVLVLVAAFLLFRGAPPEPAPAAPAATPETAPAPGPSSAPAEAPAATAPPAGPPTPTAGPAPTAGAAPAPAAPDPRVRERLLATWGAGPGQLGRSLPDEGAPVGPASLAVVPDGAVVVLDSVNERLQVFPPAGAGEPRALRLPDDTAQDLAPRPGGGYAVLDRTVDRAVTLLDADGALVGEVPLEGAGVPEAGGVTGVFARADGVWVEVEHGPLVRVADADGTPAEPRDVVAGRFQPGHGQVVSALVQRPDRVIVLARPIADPDAAPALLAEVAFALPVHHIVGLDFDAAGNIYLGVWLARSAPTPPFAVEEEHVAVVALRPDGVELSRVLLPAVGRPEEQWRSFVVTPDGIVYHLVPTDEGVVLQEVLP